MNTAAQSQAAVPVEELSFFRAIESRNNLCAPSPAAGPRPLDRRARLGIALTLEALGRHLDPEAVSRLEALPPRFQHALLQAAAGAAAPAEPRALFHSIARNTALSFGDARALGISVMSEIAARMSDDEREAISASLPLRWARLLSDPGPRRQHTPDTPTASP